MAEKKSEEQTAAEREAVDAEQVDEALAEGGQREVRHRVEPLEDGTRGAVQFGQHDTLDAVVREHAEHLTACRVLRTRLHARVVTED